METTLLERVHNLIRCAQERLQAQGLGLREVYVYTDGYAELCEEPENGIIVASNWDNLHQWDKAGQNSVEVSDIPSRLAAIFDWMGCAIEWDESWQACSECGKLVLTSPTSYGWQMYGMILDCDMVCANCLVENPHWALDYLEGDTASALRSSIDIDPEDHGYVKANRDSYEYGLHPGQDDSPPAIGDTLRKMGIERFLFTLDSLGQVDASFSVWVHEEEAHLLEGKKPEGKCDIAPDEAMKMALKSAKLVEPGPPGTIQYSTAHPDGTATVRHLTPQEFVEGTAMRDE